jgi:hypothetical protein
VINGQHSVWQAVVELLPVAGGMTAAAVLAAYVRIGVLHGLPETGVRQLLLECRVRQRLRA